MCPVEESVAKQLITLFLSLGGGGYWVQVLWLTTFLRKVGSTFLFFQDFQAMLQVKSVLPVPMAHNQRH